MKTILLKTVIMNLSGAGLGRIDKMKKIMFFVIFIISLMSTSLVCRAADGNVTYSGNAGEFIFSPGTEHSPTDLFDNFKNVMPGDTISQKITVKNNAEVRRFSFQAQNVCEKVRRQLYFR